jgi:hypothetical protein
MERQAGQLPGSLPGQVRSKQPLDVRGGACLPELVRQSNDGRVVLHAHVRKRVRGLRQAEVAVWDQ